ncbi:hypothetical protein SAY86_005600 [Trapa natans]|uniref:SAC domain-containing protein n=1 Tax=Trapa natans TaxID=22666 RepID=A0AAN7QSN0_TRANT|nr:hypothetical protein SAY86_005600 [Trapa natans]
MENGSFSGGFRLYEELELHEFHFFFRIINDTYSTSLYKTSTIYGVVGTIRLLAGTYVLVITSRNEVGNFLGFPVYRVNSMRFLYCNEALKLSTSQEKRDEVYFSYRTDITLNLQRRYKLMDGWMTKSIWKQADPRFVWNKNLMEEFIECKLDMFIILLLQGNILNNVFFQTASLELKGSPGTISLISRRCTRRLGTRMWRRGANLEGDTANFIETEQILEIDGFMLSLLQTRGSIPLLWEQIVDLSYKPQLKIINNEETSKVVERHFHYLSQRYGGTLALDLTDKHGDEGQLGTAYALEVENLPNSVVIYKNSSPNENDAIDLISGHYTLNKCGLSPLQLSRSESFLYLPVASALIVGGVTVTTLSLQQAGRGGQQFISSAVWAGVAAGVMAMVKANRRQFCSRPGLCGLL